MRGSWIASQRRCPGHEPPPQSAEAGSGGGLRIGYLSADYRWHVMAFLTIGLLEHASRSDGFEVYALSLSRTHDGTGWRERFQRAVDSGVHRSSPPPPLSSRFVDLHGAGLAEASRQLSALKLDIIVDLNGYTTDERSELLATRPAPLAIHAVGYPGTMGASFVPYMLLDRHAAPPNARAALSERLVLMPHCYQINDHARMGGMLAEDGATLKGTEGTVGGGEWPLFVNFNQLYKVSPTAGELWCALLARSPAARLWLLQQPADGEPTLRREWSMCGVHQARRVLFAPLLDGIADHLRRVSRASLLVDTTEYSSHTTGSDALYASVPMLSLPAESMASRVGASLLRSVSMPMGRVCSVREYVDAAALLVAPSWRAPPAVPAGG